MEGEVRLISSYRAIQFLLPRHYSGKIPPISLAFGWYFDNVCKAVVTYGKPASPGPCVGVCGAQYAKDVYELNRLCREDDLVGCSLSQFVSATLRYIKQTRDWVIISYSDTAMNHHGYIYQACNFIYTGITAERTDIFTGGKHGRHYQKPDVEVYRQVRSSKHRYIYFCSKKKVKEWKTALCWPVLPYPKGDNSSYALGEYMQPKIVDMNNNVVPMQVVSSVYSIKNKEGARLW